VLVGELRDLETMEIAIETAETGHLVFTTLHTNSAATAVSA
jgi:twitching motility protein PilT